ncbi:MAG: MATE family efflux transporter [Oscillospiraceae bacterium]|nr:MATE family efflux transporter [Oscillospiraceae bacterium]
MQKTEKQITLFSLALPILIEQVLRNFLGTVNVFMLGNYSDNAVAAVGVANQIMNVVLITFTMISSGAAIVINQSLGAQRREDAGLVSMNSVGISVLLGGAVSIFLIFAAGPVLALMGLEPGLIGEAIVYLQWVGGASVMIAVSSIISILFRCYGNAKIPMAVVMIINVVNVLGNYFVIFQPFPFPLHGTDGVGVIRFISETLGVVLLVLLLIREKFSHYHLSNLWRIRPRTLGKIIRIGFMSGAEGISYMLSQVVTTGFLTAFGAAALSAKVYVNTVDYYAYVIGMSIGQAAQVISGQMMGAGKFDEAYRYIKRKWRAIFLCNAAISTLIFLLHRPIMGLFTSSEEIISISAPLFALCIAVNIGRSFNHSFNYGLRAAGYVFWPMIVATSSIWLVNCGLGFVFSTVCGMGIVGLWIGMAMDDVLRGLVATGLWKSRRWEKAVSTASKASESSDAV